MPIVGILMSKVEPRKLLGDEVHGDSQKGARHSEIEVARHGQVARQFCIFEVRHAGRAHAGLREPVVEPCCRAVA